MEKMAFNGSNYLALVGSKFFANAPEISHRVPINLISGNNICLNKFSITFQLFRRSVNRSLGRLTLSLSLAVSIRMDA